MAAAIVFSFPIVHEAFRGTDDSVLDMAGTSDPLDMTILHINDHHSHLSADNFELDVSRYGLSAADASTVKVSYGGYPRLVSLFNQRVAANRNVVKIHAGDAITGSMYYSVFDGEADAEMMDCVCFDMFALGNHEFDNGDTKLAKFLDMLQGHKSCRETPVLAANVLPGKSSALKGKLESRTIKTFSNGEKVGFIGIDTRFKTMASSNPDADTKLTDEIEAAQSNIDALRGEGINKIVLVAHVGYANDKSFAMQLSGVDVIIGADSHTLLSDTPFPTGWSIKGPYPTMVTNAEGENVCIAQAWEYAHLLGELHVSFDASGAVTSCEGTPRVPFDGERFRAGSTDLNPSDAAIVKHRLLEASSAFHAVSEDPVAKEKLEKYTLQMMGLQKTVIGQVPENLHVERFPGMGRSAIPRSERTFAQSSDITDIVAKALLDVTHDGDLCIINAGSVRADLVAGDLTFEDVYRVLPFENTLVLLRMTGQQIRQVLEDALDFGIVNSEGDGAYPYAAGLRFHIDASRKKGSRLKKVEVNPRLSADWSDIEASHVYNVVTYDYIAGGKDGYLTFKDVAQRSDGSGLVELHTLLADALLDYARRLGELRKVPADEASTQEFIDATGELRYHQRIGKMLVGWWTKATESA
jgi:5'-nucleotidase